MKIKGIDLDIVEYKVKNHTQEEVNKIKSILNNFIGYRLFKSYTINNKDKTYLTAVDVELDETRVHEFLRINIVRSDGSTHETHTVIGSDEIFASKDIISLITWNNSDENRLMLDVDIVILSDSMNDGITYNSVTLFTVYLDKRMVIND